MLPELAAQLSRDAGIEATLCAYGRWRPRVAFEFLDEASLAASLTAGSCGKWQPRRVIETHVADNIARKKFSRSPRNLVAWEVYTVSGTLQAKLFASEHHCDAFLWPWRD